MGNVHFSGQNRNIPSYVLNSQHENVFESNNIRFRIEGHYLNDFSDKGIDRFIEKHFNDKTGFLGSLGLGWGGKDLEFKEVKAFIQAVAANAEQMKGMTFELDDPELGLFDDDDIKVRDIKHSFEMRYDAVQGTSDPSVSFVDATNVRYDHREARQAESRAQESYDEVKSSRRSLQKDLQSATRARNKIADRIGDNAVRRLAEIDGEIQDVDKRLSDIDSQIEEVRGRRSMNDIPASERRELGYLLRGLEAEKKELVEKREDLGEKLDKNHGFWSFLGGGSSLEDLREAQAKVEEAQRKLDEFQPEYDAARNHWQEAVHRREAVERGESLRDLDARPEETEQQPAQRPTEETEQVPAQQREQAERTNDGVEAAVPVQPTEAANPDMNASEAALQNIAKLSGDAQLEALRNLPEDQRAEFLQHANNYSFASQANNPMGFDDAVFAELSQLREGVHSARLNGLLAWGEDVQNNYLEQSDAVVRQQLLDELNQNLFNAQLASQAASLKSRLEALSPSDERQFQPEGEPQVQPPQPEQVAGTVEQPQPEAVVESPQPPAEITAEGQRHVTADGQHQPEVYPGGPGQALSLADFGQLPETQQLQRFGELAPADQSVAFHGMSVPVKQEILIAVAATNSQEDLSRMTQMMQADEKQEVANNLQRVLKETEGVPFRHTTSINMILGVLKQQGVEAQAAESVQPNAGQQEVPTRGFQAPEAVQQEQPQVTPQVEHPQVENATVHPEQGGLTPLEQLPEPVEQVIEQQPEQVVTTEQQPEQVADDEIELDAQTYALAITAADVNENPLARFQIFFGLEPDMQKDVFKELDAQLRMELLLPMTFVMDEAQNQMVVENSPERQALIGVLNDQEKAALVDGFKETLPSSEAFSPVLGQAVRTLITELGGNADATAEVQPQPAEQGQPQVQPQVEQAPVDATPVENEQGQVSDAFSDLIAGQSAPDAGRLNMAPQIEQLRSKVQEKTRFGFGPLLDAPGVRTLANQIWESGTQANRVEMGRVMVEAGQGEMLGQILASSAVAPREALDLLANERFPLKTFMNDIDDSRAFIVLYNMAQVRTADNKVDSRAMGVISTTLEAYDKTWDREEPFARLKKMTQNINIWNDLPQDLRAKIDDLLGWG